MATKEIRVCDVFGTATKDIKKYAVVVREEDGDGTCVFDAVLEICPRAFDRLMRNVRQGTTPPAKRKASDGE